MPPGRRAIRSLPPTKGAVREAVEAALDAARFRQGARRREDRRALARPSMAEEGGAAVLPPQRHAEIAGAPGGVALVGQDPGQCAGLGRRRASSEAGFRAVPGSVVRHSAFIAPGVILMPSFVNVGAYVDSGTMVDTWATVGSCAQIGKNCHLSGGVGIGGVLEPVQAEPVIIEDNCFIGARSEVAEGVIVEQGAVLSMGVLHRRLDQDHRPRHRRDLVGRVPAYSVVVPGTLPGKTLPERRARARASIAPSSSSASTSRRGPRPRSTSCCATDARACRSTRSSSRSADPRAMRHAGGRRRDRRCSRRALEAAGLCLPAGRIHRGRHRADAQPLCAPGHGRAQFLLRRPYRCGAAGRSQLLVGRSLRRRGAERRALWPRRRRHEDARSPASPPPPSSSSPRAAKISTARSASSSPATRRPRRSTARASCSTGSRRKGEQLDACVVGEPTSAKQLGDMVKIGRRGSLNGFLTVTGVQGHTAYPHLADNAAHRLLKMLRRCSPSRSIAATTHFRRPISQISTIDIGNPTTNVIPGVARRLQHPLQRPLDERQARPMAASRSSTPPAGATSSISRSAARAS